MRETGWLIEKEAVVASPSPQYLTFSGNYSNIRGGSMCWSGLHSQAIRFARKEDAWAFIAIVRTLYEDLPAKIGFDGFRPNDAIPVIVEHSWGLGEDA